MQVTATNTGFYLGTRHAGDVFDIPDAAFDPVWMKKAGVKAAPVVPPKMIDVEATAVGQYLAIRRPGDRFAIPENLFSKGWMKLAPPTPPPAEPQTMDERLAALEAKVLPKPAVPAKAPAPAAPAGKSLNVDTPAPAAIRGQRFP